MPELIEPRITALLFYSLREVQKPGKRPPYIAFEENAGAGKRVESAADDCRRSTWQTASGETVLLDWSLAHDTQILRISLGFSDIHSPAAWSDLDAALDRIVLAAQSMPDQPLPWAATHIYLARSSRGSKVEDMQVLVSLLTGQLSAPDTIIPCEATPYGWLFPFGMQTITIDSDHPVWQRSLAWIVPQERAERVEAVFLQPLNQGPARIELYLHKCLHHARQHDTVRAALETARIDMQEGMLVALRSVKFENVQREEPELEAISRKLMIFLAEKAQSEVLLNSLRSNLQSFNEHLERVKLDTPSYANESRQIQRSIEQLESDLANAQAVSESSYAFQDIQRSIESNRLERAGVLLGGAAAILAGLAIFNNFLDIWNLSVEKSGMTLPTPWLRALLGALAAVFWPLGAYQLVKRQWWRGGISLSIGVLSIILAVVFTILINS